MVDGAIEQGTDISKLEKVDDSPYLCPKAQVCSRREDTPPVQCTV